MTPPRPISQLNDQNVCLPGDPPPAEACFEHAESLGEIPIIHPGPQSDCSTETVPYYDEYRQMTYGVEVQRCIEIIRRIPDLNLFQRFPQLRERLEQLNHRDGTLQRRPQATPRPQQPPTQLPPATPRPQPSASHASTVAGVIGGIAGGGAARAASAAARALRRLRP